MPNKEVHARDQQDYIRALELTLVEQRIDYDAVDKMYESNKVKNLTFLGALFATLAFLYGNVDGALPLRDRLFIPEESYGIAVYVLAILAIVFSLGTLLWALKPLPWRTAYEPEQLDYIKEHDYVQYLEKMTQKYEEIGRVNGAAYQHKQSNLNLALPPMVAGAILLLLLKTLGG